MADERDDESAYKDHKKDWEMLDEDLKVLLRSIYSFDCLEWSACLLVGEVPPMDLFLKYFERYLYGPGENMVDIRERVVKKILAQRIPGESDPKKGLQRFLKWFLKSVRAFNATRQKRPPPLFVLLNVGTGEEEPNLKPATRDESEEEEPNLKPATRDESEDEEPNLKPATRDETEEEEKEPVPNSTAKTGGDETRWTRPCRVWMKPVLVNPKSH
jgi:hypothetical protein